eukprot:g17567.t1
MQRAKRQMGGKPQEVIFDIGSEFVSARFKDYLDDANIHWEEVGLMEAWRISKLERGNREDKRRINKATTAPFERYLEIYLWGLAMQKVEEEIFDWSFQELVDEVCEIRPNSGEYLSRYEIKEMIVHETEFQANSIPILGTCVTPYNAHFGTFDRGVRDWEAQWDAMDCDDVVDPLPEVYKQNFSSSSGDSSSSESTSSAAPRRTLKQNEIFDANVWMRRSERIQNVCRQVVREKDIELLQRRREIVGRVYQRGSHGGDFRVGQTVWVRRPGSGKFFRWVGGRVASVNEEMQTVSVTRGSSTIPYGYKDVAHIEPLGKNQGELEFYPDKSMLELIEDRGGVVVFDDDSAEPPTGATDPRLRLHTRRRDVFTAEALICLMMKLRHQFQHHRRVTVEEQWAPSDKHLFQFAKKTTLLFPR